MFSKRLYKCKKIFKFNDETVDIVDNYIYLGIHFHRTGNISHSIKRQCEQANKATFSVLKKGFGLHLDIDTMIYLYNCIII